MPEQQENKKILSDELNLYTKTEFLTIHDRHIIVFTAGKNQVILDFKNDYIELDLPTVNKHQKLAEQLFGLRYSARSKIIDIFRHPASIGDRAYLTMNFDGIVMM